MSLQLQTKHIIPLIDQVVPQQLETATFGLG